MINEEKENLDSKSNVQSNTDDGFEEAKTYTYIRIGLPREITEEDIAKINNRLFSVLGEIATDHNDLTIEHSISYEKPNRMRIY
jgi:hypothetical protein